MTATWRGTTRTSNLRISFGESGIGWIPYALDRMHFEWEDRFRDGVWPESSTYIAEQFGHLPFAG